MATTPPPREHIVCNLCGGDSTRLWAQVDDARVVRCQRCGLVYTDPRPVLAALTSSYEGEYAVEHQAPQLLRLRQRMYQVERREILGHVHGGRFLDVGCGTGEFLSLLADDFEVHGVDVSRTYVKYGREHFGLEHLRVGQLTEAGFDDAFFDVVQMRGVLQHLPDPLGQLREACRVLKPSGLLVISATPNIASPAARAFRANFRLLAPDQMLYNFSPATLTAMLDRAGLRVERFTFPYFSTPYWHWFDGLSFVWRRLQLSCGRAFGRDTRSLVSPPFPGSMMTCYARKTYPA